MVCNREYVLKIRVKIFQILVTLNQIIFKHARVKNDLHHFTSFKKSNGYVFRPSVAANIVPCRIDAFVVSVIRFGWVRFWCNRNSTVLRMRHVGFVAVSPTARERCFVEIFEWF